MVKSVLTVIDPVCPIFNSLEEELAAKLCSLFHMVLPAYVEYYWGRFGMSGGSLPFLEAYIFPADTRRVQLIQQLSPP